MFYNDGMNTQEKELIMNEVEQHLTIANALFCTGHIADASIDLDAAIDLLETMRDDTDDSIDLAQHAPAEDEAEAAAHDARDCWYAQRGG